MFYNQFGDITFSGALGFNAFSRERSVRLAEHQLLAGKSALQNMGLELTTISFEMFVHTDFGNPSELAETLATYMEDGAAFPLINGRGEIFGTYVVSTVGESFNQLATDGGIVSATISTTLREYVDPNPVETKAREQAKNALALDSNEIVPIRPSIVPPTPLAAVVANVQTSKSASGEGLLLVNQAAANPAQTETLMDRAAKKLDQAANAASEAITTLQNVQDLAAKAPALLAAMQSVADNATAAKNYAENGDITNALTQGQALTDSVAASDEAVRPLHFSQIIRKP
jgi:phage protein U